MELLKDPAVTWALGFVIGLIMATYGCKKYVRYAHKWNTKLLNENDKWCSLWMESRRYMKLDEVHNTYNFKISKELYKEIIEMRGK